MLLKSGSSPSKDSLKVSMPHTGNEKMALCCILNYSTPWIIDSGASYNMTNSFKFFQSYEPCPGNKKIKIVLPSYCRERLDTYF